MFRSHHLSAFMYVEWTVIWFPIYKPNWFCTNTINNGDHPILNFWFKHLILTNLFDRELGT